MYEENEERIADCLLAVIHYNKGKTADMLRFCERSGLDYDDVKTMVCNNKTVFRVWANRDGLLMVGAAR